MTRRLATRSLSVLLTLATLLPLPAAQVGHLQRLGEGLPRSRAVSPAAATGTRAVSPAAATGARAVSPAAATGTRSASPAAATGARRTAPGAGRPGRAVLATAAAARTERAAPRGVLDRNTSHGTRRFPAQQLFVACADSAAVVAFRDGASPADARLATGASHLGLGRQPAGALAFDGPERVYLASPGTGRVEILDARGESLGRLGADEPDFHPTALAVGPDGRVYVGTAGGAADILVFDARGRRIGAVAHPALQTVAGLALGPDGHLFVSSPELGAVLELDRRGRPVGVLGAGRLDEPRGLAFGPAGLLHVACQGSDEVVVLDRHGRTVAALGQALLDRPSDVAFDADGALYVSSPGNGRLAVFEDPVHGGFFTELEDAAVSTPVALAFAPAR